MKREFKNGTTIIHTQEDHIGVRNRLGCPGISPFCEKWRTEISIKKKKYLVGIFDNFQDACKARKIAEKKRIEGTLEQWLATKPPRHSKGCIEFWERELNNI